MNTYKIHRSIRTVFDNTLAWLYGVKPRLGPLFISWDIADRCNGRCIMCDRWKKPSGGSGTATETKIRIIRDMGKSRVRYLSLCGGEPFLEEGFGAILRAAKECRIMTNVSTNGSLLAENMDLLGTLDFLTISVDSHREEVHDGMRGIPGLFGKIRDSLGRIKHLNGRPRLYVRRIVTPDNIDELEDYIAYWQDKVDRVLLQPIVHNPGIGFLIPEAMAGSFLTAGQREAYISTLRRYGLASTYNREIWTYLTLPGRLKKRYACFSGYFSLEIDSDCMLWNCGEHRYALGNLKERTLLELMAANREKIRKFSSERACVCWDNCAMLNACLNGLLGKGRR